MSSSGAERWAENSEVVGSNPTSNIILYRVFIFIGLFNILESTFFAENTASDVYTFILIFIILTTYLFFKKLNVFKNYDSVFFKLFKLSFFKNNPGLWKENAVLTYLNTKIHLNFFYKLLGNIFKNYLFFTKFNFINFYIWRPLIKRISYFGLYTNTRTFFLKYFKN